MNHMSDFITWSPGVTLDSVEKQAILLALKYYRGNKTATANALGIAVRTLDNKLHLYQKESALETERQDHERERRQEFLRRQRGEATTESVPSPHARTLMEPVTNSAQEPTLPVRERPEVQEVLPPKASPGRAQKPR